MTNSNRMEFQRILPSGGFQSCFALPRKTCPTQHHYPQLTRQGTMTTPEWKRSFSMNVDAFIDSVSASYPFTDHSNPIDQRQKLTFWDASPTKVEEYLDATSICYPAGLDDQMTLQNQPTALQTTGLTMNNTTGADDGSFASWPKTTIPDMDTTMSSMEPFADPMSQYANHNAFAFNTAGQSQHQTQSALPLSTSPLVPAANGLPAYNFDCANNGSQGESETNTSLLFPHQLHDPCWHIFDPASGNNSTSLSSYTAPRAQFSEEYQTFRPSNSMPYQSNYNNYPVPEPLPNWLMMNTYNGLTSPTGSGGASPMSTAITSDANASFGAYSFTGSVDTNSTPLPALTYSQGSPTDLEDSPCASHHESHHHQQQLEDQQANKNDLADIGLGIEVEKPRSLRSDSMNAGNHQSRPGRARTPRIGNVSSTWHLVPTRASSYYTTFRPKNPKDNFLVESKNAGMSYKQIREKGSFTEAESTLRGRYRNLTKARDQRVRKPLWLTKDIRLLKEGLKFYMISSIMPGADPTEASIEDLDIDASKVPWKKIAEYIANNGGSYHFGNATCKKQWLKVRGNL